MKLKDNDMLITKCLSRIAGAVMAVALLLTAGGCATAATAEPLGQDPAAWQAMLHEWRSRGDAPATVLAVCHG